MSESVGFLGTHDPASILASSQEQNFLCCRHLLPTMENFLALAQPVRMETRDSRMASPACPSLVLAPHQKYEAQPGRWINPEQPHTSAQFPGDRGAFQAGRGNSQTGPKSNRQGKLGSKYPPQAGPWLLSAVHVAPPKRNKRGESGSKSPALSSAMHGSFQRNSYPHLSCVFVCVCLPHSSP